ncbi:MAG: choice-of-anchor J domain-containing protein [Candidatus Zixiibacteriota bacterium]
MQKRGLLLVLLICSAALVFGQYSIFTDDFESGLGDWDVYATIHDATGPWVITTGGHTGDCVYQTYSTSGEELETWLVYGPFYVPTTGLAIDFWQRFSLSTWHDYAGVWLSTGSGVPTAGGGDFVEIEEVDSATVAAGTYDTWNLYSTDLTGYEYEDVYVAFRYYGTYADRWYVDDVEIYCDDIMPTYLAGNVDLIGSADDSDVNVYIDELGHSDITDAAGDYAIGTFTGTFTVIADPDNPFYASDTVIVEIADGETTWVNFEIDITPVGFIKGHGDLTDITPGTCDPDIEIYLDLSGFETLTAADGSFLLESVPEGEYVVYADFDGYHTAASAPITVTAGDTIDIDTLFLYFATEEIGFYDFEGYDGGLTTTPISSGWEWGAPTHVDGPPAWSGSNVWGTVLDGDYGELLADWHLEYDMTTLGEDIVEIQFYQWYNMEEEYDGGVIDISTDGGMNWERVIPEPDYDTLISSAFGSPIGGERAYTGNSGGWVETIIDLRDYDIVTDIRFRFTSDNAYSDYPGWFIDDLAFIGLTDGPVGAIDGYVYDNEAYEPIANAMVFAGIGYTVYTDEDGYFSFEELPVGITEVSGHKGGYFPGKAIVSINEYESNTIYIPMTPANVLPESGLEVSIAYDNEDSVEIFELCNPTDNDVEWWFGPWDSGLSGSSLYRANRFEDFSRPSLHEGDEISIHNTTISPNSRPIKSESSNEKVMRATEMGSLIDVFDIPTVDTPWGIGLEGLYDVDYFWVSDIVGGQRIRKHDVSTGTYTGFYVDVEADITDINDLAADMTWDGEYIWSIMNVDLSGFNDLATRLYAFDPNTGLKVDSIVDPDGPTGTSWGESGSWPDFTHSYGLAYDIVEDVFYIGGWNTDLLYKVKGKSWGTPGEVIGTPLYVPGGMAGLGYHSSRRTVWAGINGSADMIYEIDYEAGTVINEFVCPPYGAYSIGGLEVDGDGNIWYVSMTDEKVYVLDSGYRTLPGGVYFDPPYGTLAPDECVSVKLRTSGHTAHAGRYEFDGYISVDPMIGPRGYPFTLEISPTIDYGWNMVSIPVNPIPNDPWAQLHDDIVPFDASGTGSQIYTWDPVDGRYVVPSEFERGTGYYLWGWNNRSKFDVYGDEYTGDYAKSLTYHPDAALPGWQVIGNPFNRRIDWDKVTDDESFYGIDPTAWFYSTNGGWATYTPGMPPAGISNEFDPWISWWVKMNTSSAMIPFRESYTFESLMKEAVITEEESALPEFALRISASANESGRTIYDKWNYLGVISGASDDGREDVYDHKEMTVTPPGAELLRASFVRGTDRLKDEFKSSIEYGAEKTWTMNICDLDAGTPITLSWPVNTPLADNDGSIGTSEFEGIYEFSIIHPTTGEIIDMRENHQISFIYNAPVNIFITVRNIMLSSDENDALLPDDYYISQNTPNPFNATTSFDVSLKEETAITVEIFDTRGKLVKTIVAGKEFSQGIHNFTWHGDSDNSDEVSSGVYFYKITSEDFEQTRKMMLVK